ncbi:MAG: DUF29 domain-containing protein, partial [Microcystis aeruginosa SX13-01]|nr:DUF29 domain-containing protein [Microcystis aeruginosa SX13-01]
MTKLTIFVNIKLAQFISLIKLREMSTILYDSDFDLWIEQTIQQLKVRQFERL